MQAPKPQVKLFLESGIRPVLEQVIPVFHRFIRENALGGELVIDVADYGHVPDGPGVVLIGDGSDYYLDLGDGRPGLLYSRKRRGAQDLEESIRDALRRALNAARLLEADTTFAPRLEFRADELLFRMNDRLCAPNDQAGFESVRPALEAAAKALHAGAHIELERLGSERELLSVRVTTKESAPLEVLLERLGGPPG